MSNRKIDLLLSEYGESHRNGTNKLIHWICVPTIMFTLFGLLYAIPFPFTEVKTFYANWGAVAFLFALLYYLRLSVTMFIGFVLVGTGLLYGNSALHAALNYSDGYLALACL